MVVASVATALQCWRCTSFVGAWPAAAGGRSRGRSGAAAVGTASEEALRLELTPPPLGEPAVPELRKRVRKQLEPKRAEPEVPENLRVIHQEAAKNVIQGLRIGLKKVTAVLPMGLGDGATGSSVLADAWNVRRNSRPTFRALVLMTESMLPSAEAAYRRLGGDGVLAMRIPPGVVGTDTVAKALTTCPGLIAIGSYADVRSFVMAMRRTGTSYVDLAIFEMANAALGGDALARDAVFNWKAKYRDTILQSVYLSSTSLEPNPVRGLSRATMMVPGTPPYRVIAEQGGPCGPEVYSYMDHKKEAILPVRLGALGLKGGAKLSDVARELARLHGVLGVERVEVAAGTADASQAAAAALDTALRDASHGGCRAAALGTAAAAGSDALLLLDSGVDPMSVAQALSRLVIRTSDAKDSVLLLLPSAASPTAAVAWAAITQLDETLVPALQAAAVETGRVGRRLAWEELGKPLQELVADTRDVKRRTEKGQKDYAAKVVSAIMNTTADEWDVWYGRLLAYRRISPETAQDAIPLDAVVHGMPLGRWVARQFMEWRWGSLSEEKRSRLMDGGLSIVEESDRFFADGLEEFEQHIEGQDYDPYVPPGFFTESGFALGAWAVAQRAAWRRGRLTTEQQYMLDAVGFLPVAHPGDVEARQVTIAIEAELRGSHQQALSTREDIFRKLVLRHHPSRSQSPYAETAIQFLAGYRDWYLTPPMPPEAGAVS